MANFSITTSGNSIVLDYGSYSTLYDLYKTSYSTDELVVHYHTNYIEIYFIDGERYNLHTDTETKDVMIIDTVNGLTPSSMSDLFDKLTGLRG